MLGVDQLGDWHNLNEPSMLIWLGLVAVSDRVADLLCNCKCWQCKRSARTGRTESFSAKPATQSLRLQSAARTGVVLAH